MLIQTSYNKLPDLKSCNNGQIVYGSLVSSMASGLVQLSHVKFLGMVNYPIMRSTYNANINGSRTFSRVAEGSGNITKGYTESFKLFYQSTLLSEWIGVVLAYESGTSSADSSNPSFSPKIEISLKLLNGNPLSEIATVDYGIRLDSSNSLLLSSISGADQNLGENRSYVHYAESNIEIPNTTPSNNSPVSPRPLYLPSTVTVNNQSYDVRGSKISINIDCEDCKLRHFTLFDLYEPER
tara:strand:+ start:20121 stop:20837 length:717 start_codon:yes stop_codon:yes gene_type:complete